MSFTEFSILDFIIQLSTGVKIGLSGLLAFGTTFLIMPLVIKKALEWNWTDQPNHRKVHKNPIPVVGGLGILAGILVAILPWVVVFNLQMFLILIGIIILGIMGLVDDIKEMRALHRLIIQIGLVLIIAGSGIRIMSLHGFLGIYEIPIIFQYGLTVLVVVAFINAFNFIDGIDGLAGGVGGLNALVLAFCFGIIGEPVVGGISAGIAGALLAFLYYNFNPAKIFMGDNGSMVIGFLLPILAIYLLNTESVAINNQAVLVAGVLLLPIYDIARTLFFRVLSGNSPFQPDKTHIHHLLLKTGFNHKKSALILYASNIALLITAFYIKDWVGINKSLFLLMVVCVVMTEMLSIKKILNINFNFKNNKNKREELTTENKFITRHFNSNS